MRRHTPKLIDDLEEEDYAVSSVTRLLDDAPHYTVYAVAYSAVSLLLMVTATCVSKGAS
jgi:hypothetical protein